MPPPPKTNSLQQCILFIGGLLLGVLVSITIVQNDFPATVIGYFSSTPSLTTISTTNNPITLTTTSKAVATPRLFLDGDTEEKKLEIKQEAVMETLNSEVDEEDEDGSNNNNSLFSSVLERLSAADNSWMKPVLQTFTNSPPSSQEVPKWTPGKVGIATNNKQQNDRMDESSLLSSEDTGSIPTDPRALNRMIKRLKIRQAQLEKQGIESTKVVERIAVLMAAKLGLNNQNTIVGTTYTSSSAKDEAYGNVQGSSITTTSISASSSLPKVPGYAVVRDTADAISVLDAAFGTPKVSNNAPVNGASILAKALGVSSSLSSITTTAAKPATASSSAAPAAVGQQKKKPQGKEAIVFGTPTETVPRALPDNLPIIADTFPSAQDPSLYQLRMTTSGVPPIPYHNQAQRNFQQYSPWIPTMAEVTKLGLQAPDMRLQRAEYEKSTMNLKLHLCNAVFEAYSASYLTTKTHMMEIASESYNLTWVNCEMASFIHMKESSKFYATADASGIIIQSLDVLDFSVIHLSAFERSSKRHKDKIWSKEKDRRTKWHQIEEVIRAGVVLQRLNDPAYARDLRYQTHLEKLKNETLLSSSASGKSNTKKAADTKKKEEMMFNKERFAPLMTRKVQYSNEANRTVVIMPFLGGAMGAGHSELGNRFEYLKTCFWSLYEFFPHIVAAVTRPEDVEWALERSGLPFFDMLLIDDLPKSAGLPVATTQRTKYRLMHDPLWSAAFDYVFFTESDQILISRELQAMYAHLQKYPRHMILPHRLMPYSQDAMVKGLGRQDILSSKTTAASAPTESAWMNMSCCMPRQNCVERKTWKHLSDVSVPIINYYGLYVPLGNVNFLDEKYRACTLMPYVGDYCP